MVALAPLAPQDRQRRRPRCRRRRPEALRRRTGWARPAAPAAASRASRRARSSARPPSRQHHLEAIALEVAEAQLVPVAGRRAARASSGVVDRQRRLRRQPRHAQPLPGGRVPVLYAPRTRCRAPRRPAPAPAAATASGRQPPLLDPEEVGVIPRRPAGRRGSPRRRRCRARGRRSTRRSARADVGRADYLGGAAGAGAAGVASSMARYILAERLSGSASRTAFHCAAASSCRPAAWYESPRWMRPSG